MNKKQLPAYLLAELVGETKRSTPSIRWTFSDESFAKNPFSPCVVGRTSDGVAIASYMDEKGNADRSWLFEIDRQLCMVDLQTPEPVALPRIFVLGWAVATQNPPSSWGLCRGPLAKSHGPRRRPPGMGVMCDDCQGLGVSIGNLSRPRASRVIYDVSAHGLRNINLTITTSSNT